MNSGEFQYTGQRWIVGLDMNYYKARMYSPTLSRFMQPDPLGYVAGPNLYSYVSGDPVNKTDPLGLDEDTRNVSLVGGEDKVAIAAPSINVNGIRLGSPVMSTFPVYLTFGAGSTPAADVGHEQGIRVSGTASALDEAKDIVVTARRQLRQASNQIEGSLDAVVHILSSPFIGIACAIAGNAPCTLAEQLAIDGARGNYHARRIMQGLINDPRYPENVWGKFQYVHRSLVGENITVHFWRNLQTGAEEGFKIKR